MSESKKNKYALKTVYDELIEKGYMDENDFVYNVFMVFLSRTNVMKSKNGTGMADEIEHNLSHLTTRTFHMIQAAILACKMAKKTGLNSTIALGGMLGHDIGHSFFAHEGETALTVIGILLNTGFFHHNAKGIDTAMSEGIVDKIAHAALASINDDEKRKEVENDPEMMKRLYGDAWYFLELIVGHDGEATRQDSGHSGFFKKFNSIKEEVLFYASRANRENNYKAEVSTLEAVLAKPADVLAYLKTDIENSYRRNIVKEASENFMEQVGALFFETDENPLSRTEKIEKAKKYIRELKIKNIGEKPTEYEEFKDDRIIDRALLITELVETKLDFNRFKNKSDKVIENCLKMLAGKEIEKYILERRKQGVNINVLFAEKDELIRTTYKLIETRKVVVEELANSVQEALVNDYCENTKKNFEKIEEIVRKEEEKTGEKVPDEVVKAKMMTVMKFSDRVDDIVYGKNGLKKINYEEYVQFSKKEYQTKAVPEAVFRAIKLSAKALIRTGVIRNKCNNPGVLKYIKNDEVKEAMAFENKDKTEEMAFAEEADSINYRNRLGIETYSKPRKIDGFIRFINKKVYHDKEKKLKTLISMAAKRNNIYYNIYENTQRRKESFAILCEDVYYAIPNTLKILVDKAISNDYEKSECLQGEELKKITSLRDEINSRLLEKNTSLSDEFIEEYLQEKIKYERTVNFRNNVASALAINYIGGFPDEKLKDGLIAAGFLSRIKYDMQDKPAVASKKVVKLIDKLNNEDVEKHKRVYKNDGIDTTKYEDLIKDNKSKDVVQMAALKGIISATGEETDSYDKYRELLKETDESEEEIDAVDEAEDNNENNTLNEDLSNIMSKIRDMYDNDFIGVRSEDIDELIEEYSEVLAKIKAKGQDNKRINEAVKRVRELMSEEQNIKVANGNPTNNGNPSNNGKGNIIPINSKSKDDDGDDGKGI